MLAVPLPLGTLPLCDKVLLGCLRRHKNIDDLLRGVLLGFRRDRVRVQLLCEESTEFRLQLHNFTVGDAELQKVRRQLTFRDQLSSSRRSPTHRRDKACGWPLMNFARATCCP